jgi:FG-GAP-like repeat/PASTA domain
MSVAIGDLNDDGHADLATANVEDNTVSILRNRGDGSFRAKRDYRTGRGTESVAIGDLNADRKPDVGTSNDKTVSVLVNRGDGTFLAKLDYATGAIAGGRGTATVAIGDLNGDHNPDVASANYDRDKVSVLFNKPGLCDVQDVRRQTLSVAKRILARASCRVGRIRRVYSRIVKRGRVISHRPRFGAVMPGGGKVDLVVSHGRPS